MMADAFEAPVLPEGAPWRCPMCGESYQFVNHPECMQKALRERDEARHLALSIGFRLRRWVAEEQGGWVPSAIAEIYHIIDEWPWIKEWRGG